MNNISNANFSSINFQRQLGERLRSERQRLGLSQSAAAKLGSITRATQSLYEGGDGSPSLEYLARLQSNGFDASFIFFGQMASEFDRLLTKADLIKAFKLADKLGRDRDGRLLDIVYREDLFQRLCLELWSKDGILSETDLETKVVNLK